MSELAIAHDEMASILSDYDEATQRFLLEGLLARLDAPAPDGPHLMLIRDAAGRLLSAECSVCDGKGRIAIVEERLEHRTVAVEDDTVTVLDDGNGDAETKGVICHRCWNRLLVHDNDLEVLLEHAHYL